MSAPAIASFLRETHCTVLGSAPNPVLPEGMSDRLLVCVNGSALVLAHEIVPDLTIMVGCTTLGRFSPSAATMRQLGGRSTKRLLFIEACQEWPAGRIALKNIDYRYGEFAVWSVADRRDFWNENLNLGITQLEGSAGVPSNGVLCLALAYAAGARRIDAAGFSFAGGHSYLAGKRTVRKHVEMDQQAISRLAELGAPLSFTRDPREAAPADYAASEGRALNVGAA